MEEDKPAEDDTNDDSHKDKGGIITPEVKIVTLPQKRLKKLKADNKKKKILKVDSDFEVCSSPSDVEECVDESSESDDFLERTQNAKKTKQKKRQLANKYKGLALKELTKADFRVQTIIHAKNKIKTSDTARL